MKKILIICFFAVIFFFNYLGCFAQSSINIVSTPVSWIDSENVILSKMVSGKRVLSQYNIKTGVLTNNIENRPTVKNSKVLAKNGDIFFYSIDNVEKRITQTKEPEMNPVLSPDKSRVAFTRGNDLYSIEISSGKETRYTFDGTNLILNGRSSWVYYEEILGRSTDYCAFWWSPDSKTIAFFRFDDTKVPLFPIYNSSGKHGSITETRYPKAGDPNPEVKIGFAKAEGGEVVWADFNPQIDQYFGTPYWNSDGTQLMVQWMNRGQNKLVVYMVKPSDGSKYDIYRENQESWIDWIDEVRFTKEGFFMVRDFVKWEQIYYQPFDGGALREFAIYYSGNWSIKFLDLNEKDNTLYYTARGDISTRHDVYKLSWEKNFENPIIKRLSIGALSYQSVVFSPDKTKFVALASNSITPTSLVLIDTKNAKAEIKVIQDGKGKGFDRSKLAIAEMIFISTPDRFILPASVIWPLNMDKNKKYPVIMSVYGGPNSSNVMDSWKAPSKTTQMWAQEGVIQISVDNRSSGHCGKMGMDFVHRCLGKYELTDYISWAKFLRTLPYVDADKIGITGFSYGGTMTALALTEGAEYFKFGIAGGGVYDWSLYDSFYTEKYMDSPKDNVLGYKESSVINKAALYKSENGALLKITHGTSDDNVHMQNSIQLIDTLINAGKHFEFMLYPGGKHGYRGAQNTHSNSEDILFWKKVFNLK